MSTRRNKQFEAGAPASPGHVVVDSRGRNVWQWDDNQLDSTTIMLQQLDNADLSLEPTRTARKLRQLDDRARAPARKQPEAPPEVAEGDCALSLEGTFVFRTGGGFDPYNRS